MAIVNSPTTSPRVTPDHTHLPIEATETYADIPPLPDHTQLPESDGIPVKNFQEHPQSVLLTTSIWPVLQQLHPDGQYCIGQDSGIYWRITDPPLKGCETPDWFYVPNVPPLYEGATRRSYVLWKEIVAPLLVLEFVSGNGLEERDKTPYTGKFWVYEQGIRVPFYGIYEVKKNSIELYELVGSRYQLVPPNQRGHYPIPPMGVELGLWQGTYATLTLPWLRWWDNQDNLLLHGEERAKQAQQQAEQATQQAEQATQRADRLAERLRQMGIDPNDV
jgi:Uma2 family endonuclease